MNRIKVHLVTENVVKILSGKTMGERKDIALALGLNFRTYRRIENGDKEINLRQLCRIAEIFKVKKGALVTSGQSPAYLSSPEKIFMLQRLKQAEAMLQSLEERIEGFKE